MSRTYAKLQTLYMKLWNYEQRSFEPLTAIQSRFQQGISKVKKNYTWFLNDCGILIKTGSSHFYTNWCIKIRFREIKLFEMIGKMGRVLILLSILFKVLLHWRNSKIDSLHIYSKNLIPFVVFVECLSSNLIWSEEYKPHFERIEQNNKHNEIYFLPGE